MQWQDGALLCDELVLQKLVDVEFSMHFNSKYDAFSDRSASSVACANESRSLAIKKTITAKNNPAGTAARGAAARKRRKRDAAAKKIHRS